MKACRLLLNTIQWMKELNPYMEALSEQGNTRSQKASCALPESIL